MAILWTKFTALMYAYYRGPLSLYRVKHHMRIRRALLFMPGDSRRKIEKGAALNVDSIIMDLEDGVALNNKVAARDSVLSALHEVDFGQSERLVRTNMVIPGWLFDKDIEVTVQGKPDGYVLPKVENAWQIQHVSMLLAAAEDRNDWPRGTIRLLAIIETALGVANLRDIASADDRLEALIFGAEDLAGDIGATRTRDGWEVFYARSAVVTYAKAFRRQAIDTLITDLTLSDEDIIADTQLSAQMGFDGRLAIHPKQVAPIQQVFTPSLESIRHAKRLIAAHDAHQAAGKGAFEYEGKMVDMPMVRAALLVLSRARAANVNVDEVD